MKIRYFLGFAILYIAILTGYAFYINKEQYTLHNTLFIDFSITLPIALWICLPMLILLLLTWLFLSINLVITKFKHISFNRDTDKIIAQIEEQMLGNEVKDRIYVNSNFKIISKILKRFYLLPNLQSNLTNNEKFDQSFNVFNEIKKGVEITKTKLNPRHPYFNVNVKNTLKNNPQKALDILKQNLSDDLLAKNIYENTNSQIIYEVAWQTLLQEKNIKTITKALALSDPHLNFLSLVDLMLLCVKGELTLNKNLLVQTCKNAKLNEQKYLSLAIQVCKNFNQSNINFWLDVFENLSREVEESVFAYFYVLLEVGKTSEAMDLKKQYPKNDFLPISAFISLKDEGYPLLVFFDPLLYRANKAQKKQIQQIPDPTKAI